MKVVSLCLSPPYESNDMHHDPNDPFDLDLDLDLRANFKIDLLRSNDIPFEPSRREKHDGIKIILLGCIIKKLSPKTCFPKNEVFDL